MKPYPKRIRAAKAQKETSEIPPIANTVRRTPLPKIQEKFANFINHRRPTVDTDPVMSVRVPNLVSPHHRQPWDAARINYQKTLGKPPIRRAGERITILADIRARSVSCQRLPPTEWQMQIQATQTEMINLIRRLSL